MRRNRPTRADVAALANVAASTVTIVLRNRGDELRIPKSTQDRVKQAARELGYIPNQHIQAVLRGRSGLIGMYLRADQWARPYGYWATLQWAIQSAAAAADLRLLVHNAQWDTSTDEVFARQAGGLVDGLLILNSSQDPVVPLLLNAGLPAVEVGDTFSALPFVGVDGATGVRDALRHLVERGYSHPAFITHHTQYVMDHQARISAFTEGLSIDFGLHNGRARVVPANYGHEAMPALLALDPRPDCVICASDEMAHELYRAVRREGLRVPEDLAIVGFDGLEAFGAVEEMTSIATPFPEMANLALQKLLAIIDGAPYERETVLPAQLRVGETT